VVGDLGVGGRGDQVDDGLDGHVPHDCLILPAEILEVGDHCHLVGPQHRPKHNGTVYAKYPISSAIANSTSSYSFFIRAE
jgi:hypothetical protein